MLTHHDDLNSHICAPPFPARHTWCKHPGEREARRCGWLQKGRSHCAWQVCAYTSNSAREDMYGPL
eukprot:scaffold156349_cov18-Tisochrysis_lutea.AAC.1